MSEKKRKPTNPVFLRILGISFLVVIIAIKLLDNIFYKVNNIGVKGK